jgi:hypothetical protein
MTKEKTVHAEVSTPSFSEASNALFDNSKRVFDLYVKAGTEHYNAVQAYVNSLSGVQPSSEAFEKLHQKGLAFAQDAQERAKKLLEDLVVIGKDNEKEFKKAFKLA